MTDAPTPQQEKTRLRSVAKDVLNNLRGNKIEPNAARDIVEQVKAAKAQGLLPLRNEEECSRHQSPTIVGIYWPNEKVGELDTRPLIKWLEKEGHPVCMPRVFESGDLKMAYVPYEGEGEMWRDASGMRAPKSGFRAVPSVLFIPGLAFDGEGTRLGYGKGHFDEYLALVRSFPILKDVLVVGLAYNAQVMATPIPREPHDQPVNMIITPTRIIDLR
ncbi:MAG: 5-formyltetrahydrofolate cyclo-ligase [Bdellovibrionales bacterium]